MPQVPLFSRDHEVGGPGPVRRPHPELPREGVPHRARRPARPGVPRAPLGRPLERRRRGARRRRSCLPDRRALARAIPRRSRRPSRCSPGPSDPSSSAARRSGGTTPSRTLALLAERDRHPRLPERHGRGCLPPDHPCFFQLSRKDALGAGRRRPRGRHAARLPRRLRHGADLRARRQGDPGGRRPRRDWPEPANRRGDRAATRGSVLGAARCPGARLGADPRSGRGSCARRRRRAPRSSARSRRATSAPSTTSASRKAIRRGRRARGGRHLRRRRRKRRRGGREGAPRAAARALARPRPARLPRRRRAVRHRRAARSRPSGRSA